MTHSVSDRLCDAQTRLHAPALQTGREAMLVSRLVQGFPVYVTGKVRIEAVLKLIKAFRTASIEVLGRAVTCNSAWLLTFSLPKGMFSASKAIIRSLEARKCRIEADCIAIDTVQTRMDSDSKPYIHAEFVILSDFREVKTK